MSDYTTRFEFQLCVHGVVETKLICLVCKHFGRMVALVKIKGATRQRGLELRLRDLGKIWFGILVFSVLDESRSHGLGQVSKPQPAGVATRLRDAVEANVDANVGGGAVPDARAIGHAGTVAGLESMVL